METVLEGCESKIKMKIAIALFASLALACGVPLDSGYSRQSAAFAYYNHVHPFTYKVVPGIDYVQSFKDQWDHFWHQLQAQHGHITGNISSDRLPGPDGTWTWLISTGPNIAAGSNANVGASALAGTNVNSGSNANSGSNSLSGANSLSGTNTNAAQASNEANYQQESSLSTSGSNANSGTNIHQGTNTHHGVNTGPSNYNGPLSGSSSTVNQGARQPVFIQGAVSNVGNAGSIYVP